MSLLVYALCRTGSLDPASLPRGLDGSPVHAICTERVTGLFSELSRPLGKATDDDFDAFDRVVEAAHEGATTLPVRFGTLFSDDALLSRAMRLKTDALDRALATIEGMVELNVTLTGTMARTQRVVTRKARVGSAQPVHATHGSSAMRTAHASDDASAKNDDRPQRTDAMGDLSVFCRTSLAPLSDLASSVQIQDATAMSPSGVMRCLVKRADVPLFASAFEALRDELGFEGRLSQPSPCYSFATQTLG